MRHEKPDSDIALAILKFGQVGGDGIVEPQLTGLEQLHDGGSGGDHFGERSDIENCVGSHRFADWDERSPAVRFSIEHLVFAADDQYGAGDQSGMDGIFDLRIQIRKRLLLIGNCEGDGD